METTLTKTTKSAIILTFVLSLFFITVADNAFGQTMSICPSKIVLNQQGNTESFQALVPTALQAGYVFSECSATLSIGGVFIADSYSAKYCYLDNNLMVYFDRTGVLSSKAVADMANTFQTAAVEGTFTMVNADGDYISRTFVAYDEVEIVDPNHGGR